MKVFCSKHNDVHQLSAGQVELIVYGLSFAYAEAVTEPDGDRIYAEEDGFNHVPCPLQVIHWATDGEMFKEVVDPMVEARRRPPAKTTRRVVPRPLAGSLPMRPGQHPVSTGRTRAQLEPRRT